MYKYVLRSMEGIEVFPSISLILFFAFFVFLILYVMRKGKPYWDQAAHIPLETEPINHREATP